MNTNITFNETDKIVRSLAEWIDALKEAAANDDAFSVAIFEETEETPLSIVGGWMKGFCESWNDIFCISKSEPQYAMCVKIVVNEGPYAYVDFESMNMPLDKHGEVEDTRIALELNEDSRGLANFLYGEWERLMEQYEEVVA